MTSALAIYTALVLARVGAFVAVMPMIANRTPRMVRLALALALTGFYVGQAMPNWDANFARQVENLHPLLYGLTLLREALLGAAMGFAFSLFLLPARLAGEFISLQIGLAISPLPGPSGDSGGPLTLAIETMAAVLFFVLDAHHVVLSVLHASFVSMPLGSPGIPSVAPMILGLQSSYELGLLLAAPLSLCLFLLAVLMAIMARAAPQINVYSVGFTLQVFVALLGTLYLLPEMARSLVFIIGRTGDSLAQFLRG